MSSDEAVLIESRSRVADARQGEQCAAGLPRPVQIPVPPRSVLVRDAGRTLVTASLRGREFRGLSIPPNGTIRLSLICP